jgi:hypothetical protein
VDFGAVEVKRFNSEDTEERRSRELKVDS